MRNCYFEDCDINIKVRPLTTISKGVDGYFIDVAISKKDLLILMISGIFPDWDSEKKSFKLAVRLNNNTKLYLNGLRVTSLEDERLLMIPLSKLSIRELSLKKYSTSTNVKKCSCYAVKLNYHVDISRR